MRKPLSSPAFPRLGKDFREFLRYAAGYGRRRSYRWFNRFETAKDSLVDLLYKRRGKYSRPFLHTGMMALLVFGVAFGPLVVQETTAAAEDQEAVLPTGVLSSVTDYGSSLTTTQGKEVAQFRGGEILEHSVEEGETLSSIALRYNLSLDTLLWENNLSENSIVKPGDKIKILPVDGVRHKVKKGETIFTIGKTYGLDSTQAQAIVNYPFNEFQDDENFTLTVGQFLMVPDGVKPSVQQVAPRRPLAVQFTPNAGSVSGSGSFVWPASGRITQAYRFYHKAIDIASSGGGSILAADSGTVVLAGWPDNSGYGNRIMIDHGNGYITLYAHLSVVQVQAGQTVNRGAVIGQMGSTGRSTGTHLHFEIRNNGVLENPQAYLK